MDRTDFVIAYTCKDINDDEIHCLSCKLQRKKYKIESNTDLDFVNLSCKYLECEQIPFDNTKHIPIITIKGCKHPNCSRNCSQCIITYRYKIRRV